MISVKEEPMARPMVDQKLVDEGYTARPFGDIMLYTKAVGNVRLHQLVLNEQQPRHKEAWSSKTLRKQIEVAGGVFDPLLVEPLDGEKTDDGLPKYLVDDGHRRVTECLNLMEQLGERLSRGEISKDGYDDAGERFGCVSVECTDRALSLDERIRVWLFIHRERKEWTLAEREETAYHLIKLVGIDDAAGVLGIDEPEAWKLYDTYQIASKIELPEELQDRTGKDARITWAREIRALKKPLRDDEEVMSAIYERIRHGRIRNSKDIRVLRKLRSDDPDVRKELLDVTKDLVRDIAQPRAVPDPVRATRHSPALLGTDLATSLRTMASAIDQFQARQLLDVRRNPQARRAAKAAIEQMRGKLVELEDLLR